MNASWKTLAATVLLTFSPAPAWPAAVLEISPNGIQTAETTMQVRVKPVAPGQSVLLRILRDCDGDGMPNEGSADCRSPIVQWTSRPAGQDGMVRDEVRMADRPELPHNVPLWIEALSTQGAPVAPPATFGLVTDACGFWKTAFDLFFGGRCVPDLAAGLTGHWGPADADQGPRLTVQIASLDEDSKATVPGTRGATGVDWLDDQTLLVTMGSPPSYGRRRDHVAAGLYRLSLDSGRMEPLWKAPAGSALAMPLRLGPDSVALVFHADSGGPDQRIVVWAGGEIVSSVEVPWRVDRLLAADAAGRQVLGIELREPTPRFFQVELATGRAVDLGFQPHFHLAAMRSPLAGADLFAIDAESLDGQNKSWDLALYDAQGRLVRQLDRSRDDALAPAWSPDGRRLAFLKED